MAQLPEDLHPKTVGAGPFQGGQVRMRPCRRILLACPHKPPNHPAYGTP